MIDLIHFLLNLKRICFRSTIISRSAQGHLRRTCFDIILISCLYNFKTVFFCYFVSIILCIGTGSVNVNIAPRQFNLLTGILLRINDKFQPADVLFVYPITAGDRRILVITFSMHRHRHISARFRKFPAFHTSIGIHRLIVIIHSRLQFLTVPVRNHNL